MNRKTQTKKKEIKTFNERLEEYFGIEKWVKEK